MTIVRISTPADLAAIDALLARSYPVLLKPDYPPSVLVTALPLIARANSGLVASGRYYVAEDMGGAIVAAGGWSFSSPAGSGPRRGLVHIRHFVTDHRRQRQGFARAVMARILVDAAAEGATEADCLSTRTAVPFYQAMGFALLGPVDVQLRPGIVFPSIQMRRRLP
ncbi:MAG: GNAT family N-acetyltransferase [Rhodobacteraceae bacterium]|nr:GNAT family N-acetyltransferase [Paracoccaceae bacterium]